VSELPAAVALEPSVSELLAADGEALAGLGVDIAAVVRASLSLAMALAGGGKLLIFGNGGSAADAQHVAAEFTGRFERERRGLPAIALTTDTSALTAIGNDYGYERVFARQVEALGRAGDVAIGISTSGSSANVLSAIQAANEAGLTTVGLCGAPGCELCRSVDIPISVSAPRTANVQEAHLRIEHAICRAVETILLDGAGRPELIPRGSVVTMDELRALRAGWAAAGRVVVWTNGCFDIVHAGHLASLTAAASLGDVLVVGINSDASVGRLKGPGRPLVAAPERAELLAALRPVDYVVVFDDDTPETVLGDVRPDVHTKGTDYGGSDGKPVPEQAVVEAYGGRVEFLPLVPERSTTNLVARMQRPTS
jgi:phosphoheptose isomerase